METLRSIIDPSLDGRMLLTSCIIITLASFLFINLGTTIKRKGGDQPGYPLYWGTLIVGTGIWISNLVAIMAVTPFSATVYSPAWGIFAWLIATITAGFALYQARYKETLITVIMANGVTMGLGISLIHFVNIEALRPSAAISYDLETFFLALLMAITTSITLLWIVDSIAELDRGSTFLAQFSGTAAMGALFSVSFLIGLNSISLDLFSTAETASAEGFRLDHIEKQVFVGVGFVIILVGNALSLLLEYNSISETSDLIEGTPQPEAHPQQAEVQLFRQIRHILSPQLLDRESLITELIALIKEYFNYQHVLLYMMNDAGDGLFLAGANRDSSRKLTEPLFSTAIGVSLVGQAARMNRGLLISDVSLDPTWQDDGLYPKTCCEIAVPISHEGNVFGVIHVKETIPERLTQQEVRLLAEIGEKLGSALNRSRLFEESIWARGSANWEAAQNSNLQDQTADILCIEDDDQAKELIISLLKGLGYSVDYAKDADVLMHQFQAKPYACVFIPLQMPNHGLDGIELARKIRTSGIDPQPRIIGIAPNSYDIVPKIDQEEGFDGYLRKPLRLNEVREVIEDLAIEDLASERSALPADRVKINRL